MRTKLDPDLCKIDTDRFTHVNPIPSDKDILKIKIATTSAYVLSVLMARRGNGNSAELHPELTKRPGGTRK